MIKAILNVSKTKKGKSLYKITPEGYKQRDLTEGVFTNNKVIKALAVGDHDVMVELGESAKVAKLKIGDETITNERVPLGTLQSVGRGAHNRPNVNHNKAPQRSSPMDGAKAPYNFVPLCKNVIFVDEKELPDFSKQKGLDGYIELNIEAKTPIYIRKSYDEKTVKKLEELEKTNNEKRQREFAWQQSGFYKPAGGAYRIPGSSLRGMTRTLFEIATHSKMGEIDDRKLYFRSFADRSTEYKELYTNLMMTQSPPYRTLVKAGYLKKTGNNYKIVEAVSHHRVEESLAISSGVLEKNQSLAIKRNGNLVQNKDYSDLIKKTPFLEVLYQADGVQNHQHSRMKLSYSKVKSIRRANDNALNHKRGYIILSNWMRNDRKGKHMHWVISEPSKHEYPLDAKQIRDYKNDSERDSTDLLKFVNKTSDGCPCFFVVENGKVRAFGHTGLFRMAYQKSIADVRPRTHKEDRLDLAEAVFGCAGGKRTIRGRVFFEDAVCFEPKELAEPKHPKILSSPKPSSFQHYLSQNVSDIKRKNNNITGIKNYDSNGAELAGNKMYWHRDPKDWAEEKVVKEKQYTKIHPLDAGSKFSGRIRFMNLSEAELGALLFILNLPEGHYHKIGMAKPHGLGSIRIETKLNIIERDERYKSLGSSGVKEDKAEEYIKSFAQFLKDNGIKNSEDPWQIDHLRELLAMLNFGGKPANELTRYMEIQRRRVNESGVDYEYRDRPILKKPTNYKK